MTKRIQVPLTDEEYAELTKLCKAQKRSPGRQLAFLAAPYLQGNTLDDELSRALRDNDTATLRRLEREYTGTDEYQD